MSFTITTHRGFPLRFEILLNLDYRQFGDTVFKYKNRGRIIDLIYTILASSYKDSSFPDLSKTLIFPCSNR